MSRPLVALFPGQSSVDPLMFERLRCIDPEGVSDALSILEESMGRSFVGDFASNLEIQLAVFLCTRIYRRLLARAGFRIDESAGLSLGEYSHLVVAGALHEEHALALVTARGQAYDNGPAGIMAVIQPVQRDDLAAIIARVQSERSVDETEVAISNENSPGQFVVSGSRDVVLQVMELAADELFAMAQIIEERIPMHTPRFAPVTQAFLPALQSVSWQCPSQTYWSNVLGDRMADPSATDLIYSLTRHVCQPVLWRSLLDKLMQQEPTAVLVEVGPRRILSGLFRRGWHTDASRFAMDLGDDMSCTTHRQQLEELRHALA